MCARDAVLGAFGYTAEAALCAGAAARRWRGFFGPHGISWSGPPPGDGMNVAPR